MVVAASRCTTPGMGNGTTGNATNVQGVTNVVLNGPGTLIVNQGKNESLTIDADSNMMSKITTKVNGNVLEINDLNSVSNGAVKFHLTV